ncbi:endonuclease domain-containing protein [Sphingosinicella sp. LHD-64]|uniref:endonuclease domain-containing protein n=1 Tax=Sphingosinicella sp. LHD-64 TaxID=3072139 RepID=UPI00280EF3E8|nr:endonuclease domain-containing protein [Sphingosinicella sp. LHD-64]MDQ8756487.1 endonuclease domain-containing protein [Sphingosinicella sp. LHD-64]
MRYRPSEDATARARILRANATDAERAMWRLLRESFPEARFRFQVPLRMFTADFASHRARLVIEIDGGQHSAERDMQRTRLIEAEGYRVIRFWNHEVLGNPEGVWTTVRAALLERHPLPDPPPSRGREK